MAEGARLVCNRKGSVGTHKLGSVCTRALVELLPCTCPCEWVCTCASATITRVTASFLHVWIQPPELVYLVVRTRVCKISLPVCALAMHLCARARLWEDKPVCVCARARSSARSGGWRCVCVWRGPGLGDAGPGLGRVGGGSGGAARGGRALGGELELLPSSVLVTAGRGAGCAPSLSLPPPPRPPFRSPRLPRPRCCHRLPGNARPGRGAGAAGAGAEEPGAWA